MTPDQTEERIAALEDIEAIRMLKARYCDLCDQSRDPDAIAELFTADAVWDGGAIGRFDGRDAIRGFFRGLPSTLPFARHYVCNPIIEVRGGEASGRWYLLEPCTFSGPVRAIWGAGRYEEKYVKRSGNWKIKDLKLVSSFWAPFDKGWARESGSSAS
ncbi:MAG TPA: nuclear transport factor 2 family protein [Candidatus Binataceae bacterium]|nr:nuclear transport factor 2 family protein [Candidatus Binataceae bacterium]